MPLAGILPSTETGLLDFIMVYLTGLAFFSTSRQSEFTPSDKGSKLVTWLQGQFILLKHCWHLRNRGNDSTVK
jgi:hypothetical protein